MRPLCTNMSDASRTVCAFLGSMHAVRQVYSSPSFDGTLHGEATQPPVCTFFGKHARRARGHDGKYTPRILSMEDSIKERRNLPSVHLWEACTPCGKYTLRPLSMEHFVKKRRNLPPRPKYFHVLVSVRDVMEGPPPLRRSSTANH
jgi:hypothetical protein